MLTLISQQQINGAVREMTRNMEGLGQRGENLNTLQDKSDNLVDQSKGFSRGANRVRKQMWWKDMKMRMCIIVGIIVLLLIIIVPSGMCISYLQSVVREANLARSCLQPKELTARDEVYEINDPRRWNRRNTDQAKHCSIWHGVFVSLRTPTTRQWRTMLELRKMAVLVGRRRKGNLYRLAVIC